jgi:hypothetical protein
VPLTWNPTPDATWALFKQLGVAPLNGDSDYDVLVDDIEFY